MVLFGTYLFKNPHNPPHSATSPEEDFLFSQIVLSHPYLFFSGSCIFDRGLICGCILLDNAPPYLSDEGSRFHYERGVWYWHTTGGIDPIGQCR